MPVSSKTRWTARGPPKRAGMKVRVPPPRILLFRALRSKRFSHYDGAHVVVAVGAMVRPSYPKENVDVLVPGHPLPAARRVGDPVQHVRERRPAQGRGLGRPHIG